MLRTPSLTVDKTDHDTYLQTRLRGLSAGFDVDVSGAAGLTGQALKDWLDAAEDVLFSECLNDLAAMKQERDAWANKGGFAVSQAISSAILAIPLPPVRRAVLLALEQGDRNESDIAVFLCRTVRTTRKHLKELEGMGLVACRQSEPSGKMYTLTIGGDRV